MDETDCRIVHLLQISPLDFKHATQKRVRFQSIALRNGCCKSQPGALLAGSSGGGLQRCLLLLGVETVFLAAVFLERGGKCSFSLAMLRHNQVKSLLSGTAFFIQQEHAIGLQLLVQMAMLIENCLYV